ncbi:SIMPL domain-containing protein [Paracraurococcus ruber]|uniref:SIMPL domain-containing protein n=1 Tax=Paracraurococcus ruber TaxID=77675 RepID=UPI0013050EB6|nr:SIMPL domain-containing protein [Paracraurococcus ruber]
MRRPAMPTIPTLLAHAVLALAVPAATPARAQAPAETLLHLAETAQVTRPPDELRATLRAEARAATAAAAQAAVNRAVAAALDRARGVPAVTVTTGGYWAARSSESNTWQASQALLLRGAEAAPLLDLVGALQGSGLALADLGWILSPEAERAAREEASRLAIDGLQRRAAAVAAQLGLGVAGLREIRLDAPRMPQPRPMAMAARAAPAPPPASVPEDAVVAATVEAEVILRPAR